MSALYRPRMDEGKSGKTGDLTVKTSAFANNPKILLCDTATFLPSTVLLIAMCH